MFNVLMTSTMKSDPSGPTAFANSLGVPVSAAAIWALGRSADGRRGGVAAVSATGAVAAWTCADAAVAAPVRAAPAMNLRRLTSGPFAAEPCGLLSLRAMSSSFCRPPRRGPGGQSVRRYGFYEERQCLNYHDRRPCHPGFRPSTDVKGLPTRLSYIQC